MILYVFINTPKFGGQPFYPDLLAPYLPVIETFSNVALLIIPYLVLMWLILWTKIGDFTPLLLSVYIFLVDILLTTVYLAYLSKTS